MKNWKKLLAAVLVITMALLCVPGYGLEVKAVEAETLVYGDYQYEVNTDGESVTITGYKGSSKIVEIPSEIDGKNVTRIGDYAFSSRSELTSVTIPNSVTRIGLRAFMRCSGLTGLTIPSSVTRIDALAFMQCSGLTSITVEEGNPQYDCREDCNAIIETDSNTLVQGCKKTVIPNSVTSIGGYAFSSFVDLTSIEIPNSVTAIGNYAFSNCVRLTSVEIPASVTTMGSDAFMGCIDLLSIKIPSSVTSIGQNAFIQCNSVLTIYGTSGSYAEQYANENNITFKDLTNMPSVEESGDFIIDENGVLGKYNGKGGDVVIPDGVTAIGDYAFSACVNLTSIEIPNSVTKIGRSAFLSCIKLTSIEIPDSVTSVEECVFGACRGLKNITVDEGNPAYDSRNNCNAIIETASNTLVAGCGNTVIPGGVAAIGAYAFYSCETLADIEIPNSVAAIGNYAFDGCSSLTGIEIPDSVTAIGRYVFDDCSSLASITVSKGNAVYDSRNNCNAIIETASNTLIAGFQNTIIPNGVTTIGSWAFYGRSSLTSIEIPNSVTAIGENAFSKCNSGLIIYGRSGSYAEEYAKEQHIVFESLGSVESISQAAITLEKDSYIYDGTAKTPAVAVELNGKTLVLDTDYTVSYSNNINVGTAKVTVTGRDNYIGSKSVNFTIAKAGGQTDSEDSKITCKKTVYKVAYGKKPFKINATSKSGMTFTSSKPKIAAVDKNTGRVTIKNTGVATITIKAGKTSKKVAIKVSPKKPSAKSAKAVNGRKLAVKWAKDKRASGYQVQISTDKKFKKGVKSKKLSKTSYTFTKLKTGKKYYVRLRSYKKSGKKTLYSAWSKAKLSSKIKR